MSITITPTLLTAAQMGKEVLLSTGETLTAIPVIGGWKYLVSYEGQTYLVRYAGCGLEAAQWAINASQEEYDAA